MLLGQPQDQPQDCAGLSEVTQSKWILQAVYCPANLGLRVGFKPKLSSFHFIKLLVGVDTLCNFASVNGLFLLHRGN